MKSNVVDKCSVCPVTLQIGGARLNARRSLVQSVGYLPLTAYAVVDWAPRKQIGSTHWMNLTTIHWRLLRYMKRVLNRLNSNV